MELPSPCRRGLSGRLTVVQPAVEKSKRLDPVYLVRAVKLTPLATLANTQPFVNVFEREELFPRALDVIRAVLLPMLDHHRARADEGSQVIVRKLGEKVGLEIRLLARVDERPVVGRGNKLLLGAFIVESRDNRGADARLQRWKPQRHLAALGEAVEADALAVYLRQRFQQVYRPHLPPNLDTHQRPPYEQRFVVQAVAPFDEVDAVRGQHHVAALRQPLTVLMVRVVLLYQTRDGMRRAAHAVLANDRGVRRFDVLGYQQVRKRAYARQRAKRHGVDGVVGPLRHDVAFRFEGHPFLRGRPDAQHCAPVLTVGRNRLGIRPEAGIVSLPLGAAPRIRLDGKRIQVAFQLGRLVPAYEFNGIRRCHASFLRHLRSPLCQWEAVSRPSLGVMCGRRANANKGAQVWRAATTGQFTEHCCSRRAPPAMCKCPCRIST